MLQLATFTVGILVAMMPRFVTWAVQTPENTERDHQGSVISHKLPPPTSLLPQVFRLAFAFLELHVCSPPLADLILFSLPVVE